MTDAPEESSTPETWDPSKHTAEENLAYVSAQRPDDLPHKQTPDPNVTRATRDERIANADVRRVKPSQVTGQVPEIPVPGRKVWR